MRQVSKGSEDERADPPAFISETKLQASGLLAGLYKARFGRALGIDGLIADRWILRGSAFGRLGIGVARQNRTFGCAQVQSAARVFSHLLTTLRQRFRPQASFNLSCYFQRRFVPRGGGNLLRSTEIFASACSTSSCRLSLAAAARSAKASRNSLWSC